MVFGREGSKALASSDRQTSGGKVGECSLFSLAQSSLSYPDFTEELSSGCVEEVIVALILDRRF